MELNIPPAAEFLLGDPYRIRTDVKGVRGLCLNHLTNGPQIFFYFIGKSR